jgi:hypothetical protein
MSPEKFGGWIINFVLWYAIPLVLRGVALTFLWEWFIVPLGAPHISIWNAIGIAAIFSMAISSVGLELGKLKSRFDLLLKESRPDKLEEIKKSDKYGSRFAGYVLPFMAAGFGFAVHFLDQASH